MMTAREAGATFREHEELMSGARNLLVNCAEVSPGDTVLLQFEEPDLGYCDAEAVYAVQQVCEELGAICEVIEVPFCAENASIPPALQSRLKESEVVVFFSRLADQLRFQDFPDCRKCVVNYAANSRQLASPFGTARHQGFLEICHAIDKLISECRHVHVTCKRGTDFSGPGQQLAGNEDDVKIRRFPMLVFTPVLAREFSGRVAMPRILVGTGTDFYEPYGVEFSDALIAKFDKGRMTGFDGCIADVKRANRHYDWVSERFGVERNFVHSWHAGIHPASEFRRSAFEDYSLWSSVAFGNPRILHFHTCGVVPPGEISWNVLDPTIEVDGTPVWEDGRILVENIPGGEEILGRHSCARSAFAHPCTKVGL